MDPVRRDVLAMGAAATAVAATSPAAFAQDGAAASFFEKDGVRIRYQEAGSGFPVLCLPGGGLNSRIAVWQTAVINAMVNNSKKKILLFRPRANSSNNSNTAPITIPINSAVPSVRETTCPARCCVGSTAKAAGASTKLKNAIVPSQKDNNAIRVF